MDTGAGTRAPERRFSTRWYSASTWVALVVFAIYVALTFGFPLIPLMIIAGSMEQVLLYFAPPIGLALWLGAMAVRIFVRRNRRQLVWTALRYAVIAFGGAGLFVIAVASGTPGYIRKTKQVQRQMQEEADIAAIRAWVDTRFPASAASTNPAYEAPVVIPPDEQPACIRRISGFHTALYWPAKRELDLVFGGGFGHWGLTVAPEGTPMPESGHFLPLEDGAWVWHELQ